MSKKRKGDQCGWCILSKGRNGTGVRGSVRQGPDYVAGVLQVLVIDSKNGHLRILNYQVTRYDVHFTLADVERELE